MEYSEAEKQMLREVLPGIAVQLRGALANIHGALGRLAPERLRDRDTGTDRSAAILCQSYYKILRVVNNLSDAPMLAEDKPLDTENVELVELLEGLCRQGQVLAELMDLRLVFTCRDRAHVIAANRELLERLFWNLVSNAMKFTPPGGTIEVALRTGPDCVLLCVKDSGPAFLRTSWSVCLTAGSTAIWTCRSTGWAWACPCAAALPRATAAAWWSPPGRGRAPR